MPLTLEQMINRRVADLVRRRLLVLERNGRIKPLSPEELDMMYKEMAKLHQIERFGNNELAQNAHLKLMEFERIIDLSDSIEEESIKVKKNTPYLKAIKPPPLFGERVLLLVLSKEDRANIPGDLEEEYQGIAAKHGARYAKLWYYKQVGASAWPMIRKAFRWGLVASIGEWIRRII